MNLKNKVVAVIDSGINSEDYYIKGKKIKEYRYDNEEFTECHLSGLNHHGTEVSKIILKEDPNVQIVSIQILQKNNHGMLSALIKAIDFCIRLKVDIINISLGVSNVKDDMLNKLQEAVSRANAAGIGIIAADKNSQIEYAYPANFKEVIGVRTVTGMKEYVTVDYDKNMILFSNSLVCVPDRPRYVVKNGNSFLCPLITGVYSKWMDEGNLHRLLFRDFVGHLDKEMVSKIFFNHYEEKDRNLVVGKKVMFFTDNMDSNNSQIFNMYKEVCNIKDCFNDIFHKNIEEVIYIIKKADIFFIGALSGEFIHKNEEYLKGLTMVLVNYINVITVYPLLNISERIKASKETPYYLKTIYK